MASKLIMAIGLDYSGDENTPKKQPGSVKANLQALYSSTPIRDIGKNKDKAIIELGDYDETENLIINIYNYSEAINNSASKEKILHFYIVLMAYDSEEEAESAASIINLLNSVMEQKLEKTQTYPVQIYITEDVYRGLIPDHQDLYHSAVEVAGNVMHQRFAQDAQRCFVISPIGEENSDIRKHADYIFERYIKPACETTPFRAVRGEMMRGNRVIPELMEALQSDPMIVVYLGNPKWGWNPNVMYELGIREAHAAPYVIIKDSTSNGKPYNLPFDLKDSRIVDVSEQEEDNPEHILLKIRTIRERIQDRTSDSQWDCLHPNATIDMKLGDTNRGASRYVEASKDLEALFEMKEIVGRDLLSVTEHLMKKMPITQRTPFIDEQNKLIFQLLFPAGDPKDIRANATVPFVFQQHQTLQGRAFLPIIVRYYFNKLTSVLRLKVLYIDVTSATKLNERGYYICALTGDEVIKFNDSDNTKNQQAG